MVHKSTFRPELEGIRAIAILLVVFYHAGVPGFGAGFIGVDIFFVLSGYLITGILMKDAARPGGLRLTRFYARRARRLLPASALMVAVTLFVGRLLYAPNELRSLAAVGVATSGYLANVSFIRSAANYLGGTASHSALLHTWSLSVEEQFYVFWPLLVGLAWRLGRRHESSDLGRVGSDGSRTNKNNRGIALLGGVTALSFLLNLYWTSSSQPLAFFGSPARAWEFGVGALAGQIPLRKIERRYASVTGLLGLALLFLFSYFLNDKTSFPGAAAVPPVLGAALMLRSFDGAPQALLSRSLAAPVAQWFGKLSYSWYLWHWPVLVYARSKGWVTGPWSAAVACAAALLIALGSYHGFENPLRNMASLRDEHLKTLAVAAALTVSLVGGCLGVRAYAMAAISSPALRFIAEAAAQQPILYADGCFLSYEDEAINDRCVYGQVRSDKLAVLFGDSHAAMMFPAMERIARQQGWRLVVMTKSACPSVDVPLQVHTLRRPYRECAAWRHRVTAWIQNHHPDVIFLTNSSDYVGADRVTPIAWRSGLRRTLQVVSASAKRVIVLRDSPRMADHVPNCLARRVWPLLPQRSSCDRPRQAALSAGVWEAERAATAEFSNVQTVDLSNVHCGPNICRATKDGASRYFDSNHLAVGYVRSLSKPLSDALRLKPISGREPRAE